MEVPHGQEGMRKTAEPVARAGYILAALLLAATLAAGQARSPEELYKDAGAAYDRGDLRQAIVLYEELLKLRPDSVPIRTNLAVALVRAGRYDEAIGHYREALRREPDNPVVRLNLALAWYKQAEFREAAAELESLRRTNAAHAQPLYLLADCYLRLGRNADAVALLQPAYDANPQDRAVDYALGMALIRQGQIDKGQAVIDQILRHGESAEASVLLGAAQLEAGEYKTAALTLEKALKTEPELAGGWSLYGRALLDSGENEGAKAAFTRALKNDPNDFEANLYQGGLLRHDGNLAEATPYLERALRLRPASVAARFQIGALHLALGRLEDAGKDLEQVAREWPDFQEVHVQLATLYARLGRKEDSQRERDIVLKLNEKARARKAAPGQR